MAETNGIPDKATVTELIRIGRTQSEQRLAGNTPYVVIPNDCKVVELRHLINNEDALSPVRKKGIVRVHDAESFVTYHQLFCDENSRVFADETKGQILSILDYHATGDNAPRWCQHRLDMTLRHSVEWTTWLAMNGKRVAQEEFANFLEDNAPDVMEPSAAAMLEVARDLSAKTDVDFGSAMRLSDGSVKFKYSEQTKATVGAGEMTVPESFKIAIPVYLGTERISITARLRYRITGGHLTFWFDLLRADAVAREGFLAIRRAIAETLGVAIINGSPA